jgi:FkbM family methyltransferase
VPHLVEQLTDEFPGVEVRPVALSDRDGAATYIEFLDKGFVSLSGLAEQLNPETVSLRRHTATTIRTERFDDHVPDGWLPDVVKIDVEGAELQVLEGAVLTLRKAKPLVAFEHGQLHGNSDALFTLLCEDVGLRLFNMDGEGPLDRSAFIDQLASRWNWVAHE